MVMAGWKNKMAVTSSVTAITSVNTTKDFDKNGIK